MGGLKHVGVVSKCPGDDDDVDNNGVDGVDGNDEEEDVLGGQP